MSRGGYKIAISQSYSNQEASEKWETFFEEYNYIFQINEVAAGFPEKRSVYVEFSDLDMFDPDFCDFI
ncbi:MAG TPA: hypothetical protein ENN76_03580, partial [Euryarchaeota archaeon]|nr:hypothetical protein [Euryarchaeota archaeon]